MPIHIVSIGRHKFVCGLFWQSLSRPRDLRKEAQELAAKVRFDLMVLRREYGTVQAGYASASAGVKAGMLSLGVAVSSAVIAEGMRFDAKQQRAGSWLGAFRLQDDLWAYFAVREESFLPNGDCAGTREEVMSRLQSDYALGGWNVVLGDAELAEFGFHSFQARTLEQLLPRRGNASIKVHAAWALEPVHRRLSWKPVAAVLSVALVGAAATAWQFGKRASDARPAGGEAARRAIPANAGAAAPHPWPAQPRPQAFVEDCVNAFDDIGAGGWHLDSYHCAGGAANHAWTRGDSTVGNLLATVPTAVVELNGDKAHRATRLPMKAAQRDDELDSARELLPSLTSRLQSLGLAPTFSALGSLHPPAPKAQASTPNDSPPPDWKTFKFKVDARGIPPVEVAAVLDRPGVRAERLTYAGGSWSIEGVIYAK